MQISFIYMIYYLNDIKISNIWKIKTDLFIRGAPSGHQVQVESSETKDRDEKQPWYADHYQTGDADQENLFALFSN